MIGEDDVFFAAELPEERRAGDTRRLGDLLHRRLVVAVFDEEVDRRGDNRGAAGRGGAVGHVLSISAGARVVWTARSPGELVRMSRGGGEKRHRRRGTVRRGVFRCGWRFSPRAGCGHAAAGVRAVAVAERWRRVRRAPCGGGAACVFRCGWRFSARLDAACGGGVCGGGGGGGVRRRERRRETPSAARNGAAWCVSLRMRFSARAGCGMRGGVCVAVREAACGGGGVRRAACGRRGGGRGGGAAARNAIGGRNGAARCVSLRMAFLGAGCTERRRGAPRCGRLLPAE